MRVEVVVIGNELLNGDLADTNTQRLGRFLRARGLRIMCAQVVADDPSAILAAFELATRRAELIVVSGGLGPTTDDITVEVLADFAGVSLHQDLQQLERIKARFQARGYPFTENNAKQALIPAGGVALTNREGTAPGVSMHHEASQSTFFLFPGVPRELQHLAETYLGPWLTANAPVRPYRSAVFKTFGNTESQVAERLSSLEFDPRVHVAYRAHFPEIGVSLHVWEQGQTAGQLLRDHGRMVRAKLADLVFSEDPAETYVGALGRWLVERGETIATAESCTGGLVAKMLTDIPGSSAYLERGLVTYSNLSKQDLLEVSPSLITRCGAVSEEVARAMAEGVRTMAKTTYGVAITGIAGPGGATESKPTGTVHFAVAGPLGTWHRVRTFPFDRARNRIVSAYFMLDMVRRYPKKMNPDHA